MLLVPRCRLEGRLLRLDLYDDLWLTQETRLHIMKHLQRRRLGRESLLLLLRQLLLEQAFFLFLLLLALSRLSLANVLDDLHDRHGLLALRRLTLMTLSLSGLPMALALRRLLIEARATVIEGVFDGWVD